MRARIGYTTLACTVLASLLGTLPVPATAGGRIYRAASIAGDYSVTLELLPPASFTGSKADLVRDGGAEPTRLGGSKPPNHRFAVFVMDNGKPVEQAQVVILYRGAGAQTGWWVRLPVTRMHVAGKGLDTTQFGNNVQLAPGIWEVRVSVNGEGAATFRFVVHS